MVGRKQSCFLPTFIFKVSYLYITYKSQSNTAHSENYSYGKFAHYKENS